MDKNCGVYKITSPDGKIYIGQSTNMSKRFYIYRRGELGGQKRLSKSFNKYGWINHKFDILHICHPSQLSILEKRYIKKI